MGERRYSRSASEQGFTLVELLMVMLITSIIGGSIVGVVTTVSRVERVAMDMSNNLDAVRVASERVRDVIRASYAICDDSTAQVLRLWRDDTDGDRRVDADEITRIIVADGALQRIDGGGASRIIARGVGTHSFSFADAAGNTVPVPLTGRAVNCAATSEQEGAGDVTIVNLSLSGDRAPDERTPPTVVDTRITLRNAVFADGTIEPNRTPNASFKFTCSPPSCTFDASESHDEDGVIMQYLWDFGGLATGSGKTTSYVFPLTGGNYPVTLTVVDDGNASARVTQFVEVGLGNANPAATFTYSCSALTCTFEGVGTDSDGTVTGYDWTFGDDGGTATGASVAHTYAAPGAYAVTLTVTDNEGATGSHTQVVNPNTSAGQVALTLHDVSTARDATTYFARVQITVKNADGSPAVGVTVRGRFGGETSPLVAQDTNAEGTAVLQASGDHREPLSFTVVEVVGRSVSGQTFIMLKHPA